MEIREHDGWRRQVGVVADGGAQVIECLLRGGHVLAVEYPRIAAALLLRSPGDERDIHELLQ